MLLYDTLDVTGAGAFLTDQVSYDIFAQAAAAVRSPVGTDPMAASSSTRCSPSERHNQRAG
jgi:hypothetical protein